MSDIETDYTHEAVCPHCGHLHRDTWELFDTDDDVETECVECGKPFVVSRNVSVDYSTRKAGVKP